MKPMFIPIDVEALSRRALRGYGPEDPAPLQPTARPRWTPVSPFSRRSRASGRRTPSSAR
jgi:hypothetical protein